MMLEHPKIHKSPYNREVAGPISIMLKCETLTQSRPNWLSIGKTGGVIILMERNSENTF